MSIMLRWVLILLLGCTPISPVGTPERALVGRGPDVNSASEDTIEREVRVRLVRDGDGWFIAGLSADAAGIVEQGRIFAVMQPIAATPSMRPVAVMTALGPVVGRVVPVAPLCIVPETALREGLAVEALSSATEIKVGGCLARVVESGRSEHGEEYVVLNVGSGAGVSPGDQYSLLGRAVTSPGFVPLGLDSAGDGLCQIPGDTLHLKVSTSRCAVVRPAGGFGTAVGSFALRMQEAP